MSGPRLLLLLLLVMSQERELHLGSAYADLAIKDVEGTYKFFGGQHAVCGDFVQFGCPRWRGKNRWITPMREKFPDIGLCFRGELTVGRYSGAPEHFGISNRSTGPIVLGYTWFVSCRAFPKQKKVSVANSVLFIRPVVNLRRETTGRKVLEIAERYVIVRAPPVSECIYKREISPSQPCSHFSLDSINQAAEGAAQNVGNGVSSSTTAKVKMGHKKSPSTTPLVSLPIRSASIAVTELPVPLKSPAVAKDQREQSRTVTKAMHMPSQTSEPKRASMAETQPHVPLSTLTPGSSLFSQKPVLASTSSSILWRWLGPVIGAFATIGAALLTVVLTRLLSRNEGIVNLFLTETQTDAGGNASSAISTPAEKNESTVIK